MYSDPVFGLYVHIPWCRTHCPYCDFNVVAASSWPEERYTAALVAEIDHYSPREPWRGSRLESVFFGGGTPSLFSAASIERVLAAAARSFDLAATAEISLEANPETVSVEKLGDLRRAGVNRLSFGIESFEPHVLKRLGRLQTAAETLTAVPMARSAGFDNVSLDLIFAVPGQSLADWRRDLDTAIAFTPEHVSAYNLTYEEGTPFFELRREGKLRALDDDLEAAMFEEARARLGAAGYGAYEVSNFARPGFEARHNLNTWQHGLYLGIGAGAHSHERLGETVRRWVNEKHPDAYARRATSAGRAVASEEKLEPRQSAGEFVFLGLRLAEGFAEARFRERFGRATEDLFPDVSHMVADGLLERRDGQLRLTDRGLRIADSVFASFL